MTIPDHLIDRDGDVWIELHPGRFWPVLVGEVRIPDEVADRHPGLAVPLETLYQWVDGEPNPDPAVALAQVTELQADADARAAELQRRVEVCDSTKELPEGSLSLPVYLSVDHLKNLREAWEYGADDDVLIARVRDLFGGVDGHLTRIDRVLAGYVGA